MHITLGYDWVYEYSRAPAPRSGGVNNHLTRAMFHQSFQMNSSPRLLGGRGGKGWEGVGRGRNESSPSICGMEQLSKACALFRSSVFYHERKEIIKIRRPQTFPLAHCQPFGTYSPSINATKLRVREETVCKDY